MPVGQTRTPHQTETECPSGLDGLRNGSTLELWKCISAFAKVRVGQQLTLGVTNTLRLAGATA
ncbi:MAG: hypothetical protein ACK553_08275, partial [Planctomycetota bacterium]